MRTKTLLLFVLLFTGMVFSQQNNTTKQISFGEVLSLLGIYRLSSLKQEIGLYGYRPDWEYRDTYKKGMHSFKMFRKGNDDFFTYLETNLSAEREESLKTEALAAGFNIVKEDPENIEMSNNIFVIYVKKGQQIEITRK